jgi:hypothetical protein
MNEGDVGLSSDLVTEHLRAPKINKAKFIQTPIGRFWWTRDRGESTLVGREQLITNLSARHRDGDGKLIQEFDLGSGLVTNAAVLALLTDALPNTTVSGTPLGWPTTNAPNNVLRIANFHVTGTGATAAAATDIKLQTPSANGGQTPVTGALSGLVPASFATMPKLQTVATVSYTGSEAVTEWVLLSNGTLTATTGSPFTAGTATSGTVTATPLTASSTTVLGHSQLLFENTGNATPSWGLSVFSTTSVVTVGAWYKVSDGTAGANPANTNAYTIRPIPYDRKVFSAINVASGDSIQFTYQLAINSGG